MLLSIVLSLLLAVPFPTNGSALKENTQYVIKKSIDLQGRTITVPKGSTLVFKRRGSLSNGALKGEGALLENPKLESIHFFGSFVNKEIVISDRMDGETDFWGLLKAFPESKIILDKDITIGDSPKKDLELSQFVIEGNGHTIHVSACPHIRKADVRIENVVFDCRNAGEFVIYAIGEPGKSFAVRNCRFVNLPETTAICPRAYSNGVVIEECSLLGTLTAGSKRKNEYIGLILVYNCEGQVIVRNNVVKNCFGVAIDGLGFKPDERSSVLVENNEIDFVSNGGIAFVGGEVWNAVVRGNVISRTHALGAQFPKEIDGGPNSAINFHGFRNAVVEDNRVSDCPHSSCMDFDGSASGKVGIAKGTCLQVRNNKCKNAGNVALFYVQDVQFCQNAFESKAKKIVYTRLTKNVVIEGNTVNGKQAKIH